MSYLIEAKNEKGEPLLAAQLLHLVAKLAKVQGQLDERDMPILSMHVGHVVEDLELLQKRATREHYEAEAAKAVKA